MSEPQDEGDEGLRDGDALMGTPTTPQANRAAMQGAGVGQREMDAQQDPTRTDSQENTVADERPARDPHDSPGDADA